MIDRLGQLRALGLLCMLAGCSDDGGGATEATTSGTGTDTGTDGVSTTTPTTSDGTTTRATTPTTSDGTTTDDPGTTTAVATSTTSGDTDTGGAGECDPTLQDCPEGSKCTAYGKIPGDAWNANKCVPEPANGGAVGDSCEVMGDDMFSGIDTCGKGTVCLNTDPEMKNGFCVEFCTPEMQCPGTQGGKGLCIVTNDGALPICLFTCDPLLQDCLGNGACYGDPAGPPFICFTPDPVGGGMDGDSCAFTNACLAGLSCTQADTQEGCMTDEFGCCAPFCALDEMTCTGTEECVPFFMVEQPGFENVGVCALPG